MGCANGIMAPLKLYADLRSQPSRAVYILLKANKIPFEFVKVDLFAGEHKQDKYTKINPSQQVPFIEDNGFTLGESAAILCYIAQKSEVADHWYPKDPKKRARVDEYLHWHHSTIRLNATTAFRLQFFEALAGRPINQEEVAKYKTGLANVITQLGNSFLKGRSFLAGDDISVADLQALCELMQLDSLGQGDLYLSNGNVKKWMERVKGKVKPLLEECDKDGIAWLKKTWSEKS
ncbi:glutathione S-transferase theta-1-like [Mya arenaria]|uniref:glutathione S-transferase theta-1-like n=1 Tax=Mya arenaria TaxID=6604 RepID=UPI0022E80309|nr:glutathione S-transferase theta-1-like [Mya arenaria]